MAAMGDSSARKLIELGGSEVRLIYKKAVI